MTNKEVAEHIRNYYETTHSHWSWPTDGCGYEQHIKFVKHRNKNWKGKTQKEFKEFALAYANDIEQKEKQNAQNY